MSHQRVIHIFTYQTYLQGEFLLFSEEVKTALFLDPVRENTDNLVISCIFRLMTNQSQTSVINVN